MRRSTASLIVLTLLAIGCSRGATPKVRPSPQGTIRIPLVARGTSGTIFGLRDATFAINGTDAFDTEPFDPGRVEFLMDLPGGGHSVLLREGWQLVQSVGGGSFADVPAQLVSENPTALRVVAGQVVEAVLRFRVQGEVVVLGRGPSPSLME